MKVFLDTNVVASGIATRGLCADVVRCVIESYELVVSELLLVEVRRTLKDKFGLPADAVAEAAWMLMQDSVVADDEPPAKTPSLEEADGRIVSAAINGQADVLVTGDKDVQALKRVQSLRILSPRQFWEEIRQ